MSYSRRQLEAFGEPLGDSATYRKADGGLILGGGGSSAPAQPSNTTSATTQTQDLPDWAKPYAQDVLSKGKAVTDISQNPYQSYGGNRIAGFSGLQNQAQTGVANIQTGPAGFQQDVGGYMNPYMNQILAPRLAEANRQYDISGMNANAQATQAGAFGGGRQALMQAENERNRNTGLSQIYGQGLDTAFGNAQNQYNQGFGQNIQALGLQNQIGGQQQAQEQRGLDVGYQDFLTQKNYPYQQLSYMANLVRGTPMGMNTQSQVYQAPPTGVQNISALGMGAYGLSKLAGAKEGGLMNSYAPGGSVTSEENVKSIANFLPKEQVPKSLQMAQQRHDLDAQLALQKQMAENNAIQQSGEDASIQRGLGSAFNSLPPQVQNGVVRAAGGGILAFKDGDVVDSSEGGEAPDMSSMFATRVADPRLQAQLSARQLALIDYLSQHQGVTPGTKDERMKFQGDYMTEAQKAAGPSPYGDYGKNIDEQVAGLGKERNLDEAAAAFKSIPAILQPGGTARGLAGGAAEFGGGMAQAAKNQRLAKANLSEAQFKLKDAERKERMGLYHESRSAYDSGQKSLLEADKNATAAKTAAANAIAKTMAANKVTAGAGGAGAGSKEYVIGPAELLPQIVQEHPEWSPEKQKAEARRQYMAGKSAGYQGVETKVESTEQIEAAKRFAQEKLMKSKDYRAAKGDATKIAELDRQVAAATGYKLPASHPAMQGANTPAPAGGAQPLYATNGKDRIVSTDNGKTWKPVGAQ
jgi:hypothetical protein